MSRLGSASRLALALVAFSPAFLNAQSLQKPVSKTIESSIAEALAANPLTAPYRLTVESKNKQVVLKGRVGGKMIHDAAVRTAIAFGVPVVDDLVIDTAEAARVLPPVPGLGLPMVASSYTYPPYLFGRFDDPFFGLEPPLATFPPWWGELSRYRLGQMPGVAEKAQENQAKLPANTVEMTIDPLGVAVVRGTVPSELDKTNIGEHLMQVEGVTKIINKLAVDPSAPGATQAAPPPPVNDDQPPPPPTPSIILPKDTPPEPAHAKTTVQNTGPMSRIDRAIQARPELAGSGIKVSLRDGVASISGHVPTVYEAMLAYRAVQRTPGVREINDAIQFVVPDGTTANPLLDKAKPDDVEPYLEAQLRRQLGDAAHVDRVRLGGNQLEIKGILGNADDRTRVEAILRSMPILRGFTLLPEFAVTDK